MKLAEAFREKIWPWMMVGGVYLVIGCSLTPVYDELNFLEMIRLKNAGWKPSVDFGWLYGILPFFIYGFPMQIFGNSLFLSRLPSVITALLILWQSILFFKEQGVKVGYLEILGIILLISIPQQHAYSHTLVTLAAIMVFRVLGKNKRWSRGDYLILLGAALLAFSAKPLCGGVVILFFVPFWGKWTGQCRWAHVFLWFPILGIIFVWMSWWIVNDPWWIMSWYECFKSQESLKIVEKASRSFAARVETVTYLFRNGFSTGAWRTYISTFFPCLLHDFILIAAIFFMFKKNLSTLSRVIFMLVVGISFQSILWGQMGLLGYAQEYLPLSLILLGLILKDVSPGHLARIFSMGIWYVFLIFLWRFTDVLIYERSYPVGVKGFEKIHLLPPKDWPLYKLAWKLPEYRTAMTLGSDALLIPPFVDGKLNFGAVCYNFYQVDCFENSHLDQKVKQALRRFKPDLLLISLESMNRASRSESLEWIRKNYQVVDPGMNLPIEAKIFKKLL